MTSEHSWTDYAASYALDALDADDKAAFEAHLQTCDACRGEVESYREVAGQLAQAAPEREPPARLRERVLNEARQVRPITSARFVASTRAAWLTAAASLIIALGIGSLYVIERSRGREAAFAAAAANTELAQVQSQLAERDSLIATLLTRDLQTAQLAAQGRPPSARLYFNRESNRIIIAAYDMPPAKQGRTYQLWGISGTQAVSIGTFNTDASGRAVVAFSVPLGARYQLSGITEEPAGGSPAPTMTPILLGAWTAP